MSYVFTLQNGKRQTKFVAGLKWFPLVPDNFKKDLLPLAADMAADTYVYRKSNKSVVGLGKTEDGVGKEMAALGLFVSRHLEEISADIYALAAIGLPGDDDRYAFFIIRDGFIMPDGDKVGSREEIEALFTEAMSSGDWERQYCPADWDISNTEELSLESVLSADKKGRFKTPDAWLTKPVKPSLAAKAIKAVALLALVAVPLQGYQFYRADQVKKQLASAAAAKAAMAEQAHLERMSAEPWKNMVSPNDFAKACSEAIRSVGLVVGSWEVHEFACAGDTYTIKWERSAGETWVKQMRAVHPGATISRDGAIATLVTKLKLPQNNAPVVEKLQPFEDQLDRLRDLPNEHPVSLTLRFPPAGPTVPGSIVEAMPWSEVKVGAATELAPETAASILAAPGYRINSITGSFKAGVIKYEIEGVQYGKI